MTIKYERDWCKEAIGEKKFLEVMGSAMGSKEER